jgi:hypothetical protein
VQPTEAENRGSLCKPGRVINERKMEAKTILIEAVKDLGGRKGLSSGEERDKFSESTQATVANREG